MSAKDTVHSGGHLYLRDWTVARRLPTLYSFYMVYLQERSQVHSFILLLPCGGQAECDQVIYVNVGQQPRASRPDAWWRAAQGCTYLKIGGLLISAGEHISQRSASCLWRIGLPLKNTSQFNQVRRGRWRGSGRSFNQVPWKDIRK